MTTLNELTVRPLEEGENLKRAYDSVTVKKGIETFIYHWEDVPAHVILSKVLEEHPLATFQVTCDEEQYFLSGLHSIRGFKLSGTLVEGGKIEISFEHFYLEAEELLDVENDRRSIGNPEYDERTTEWTTDSTVNKESELYLILKKHAEACEIEEPTFRFMMEEIAERCTGSDVEY